jgi:WD40 repeat protein
VRPRFRMPARYPDVNRRPSSPALGIDELQGHVGLSDCRWHVPELQVPMHNFIWDAWTGAMLAILAGHTDAVNDAIFSPDGSLIVTDSADKTVRVWHARTGATLAILAGHRFDVMSAVRISPICGAS